MPRDPTGSPELLTDDNNEVLTVKLVHETSLVAYSTDKRSKLLIAFVVFLGIVSLIVVILQFCIKSSDSSKEQPMKSSDPPCSGDCTVTLVESIPENVKFPAGSVSNPSTYSGWMDLLKIAQKEIDIASFYWTLRGSDTETSDPSTKKGEDVLDGLEAAAKRGKKLLFSHRTM